MLTDSKSNRFFLNKAKTDFVRYNKNDVYVEELGSAMDMDSVKAPELKKMKQKIFDKLPDEIGKYNKFEDDIEIMTSQELEGAPAALYGSDESIYD